MAEGKWITELTPTTPLADAARRTLSVRLAVVHEYLPRALRQPFDDPEHVHQLRVGTRRAGAALEIFARCLSDKDYRSARKHLRRLRRAAGDARDWDVFLLSLEDDDALPERQRPAYDLLRGYALARRTAAQQHLEAACPNHPFDFEKMMAETVAAVHRPHGSGPQVLREMAEPLLAGLFRELHTAAGGNLDDYDHLHQVRIIGKRLRYAMEIVADCFGPGFREALYSPVEQMQEVLGNANDSHVAAGRLAALCAQVRLLRPAEWRRYRPGLHALLRHHQERVPQERQRFSEWWANWQQTGGEDAFRALLTAPAAQPGAAAGATGP